ncbi:MAG: type II toxin-antitoxin system RelE/ParE family toxin [Chthoniobacterales bacterium]
MSLRVTVRDEAEADIAQAAIWYERQSAGLGTEFVHAADECFNLLSRQPEAFPVVYRSARLGLLHKFPYLVVYRVFPDFISVVAVMHGRRHPRRWKARLTD